jgi:hypothetical protein
MNDAELEKAYSGNEEDWETEWGVFLDVLMNELEVSEEKDLIGTEYFECDQVPVTTDKLVDIDAVLDVISETAFEVMGEYGDDYPRLKDMDKAELKEMIVTFLDKKDGRGIFNVKNVVKKTITAEDLREAVKL